MRIIGGPEVEQLLDMASCIQALEHAFRTRGEGGRAPSAVCGVELPEGGLHAKLAMLDLARSYAAAKINANLPGNPTRHGLPTIQGLLVLFDALSGAPLAVMDSGAITTLRTAAASAVAARHLALEGADTATFIGCGVQARAHLAALQCVRPVKRLFAFDIDVTTRRRFADEARDRHGLDVEVAVDLRVATLASTIIITTTPSRQPVLHLDDVSPGTFIAAVGADHEHKHEIDPLLLRAAAVVVDDLAQCAQMGDLNHALTAGVMQREDVRASLDQVIAGTRPGRHSDDEIIIFDSTGVAIEDVAAAALVYERASTAPVSSSL
jgi:alanine dehydrogenase